MMLSFMVNPSGKIPVRRSEHFDQGILSASKL